jgi:hypothetical protein
MLVLGFFFFLSIKFEQTISSDELHEPYGIKLSLLRSRTGGCKYQKLCVVRVREERSLCFF